jgi:hypothetical protein
MGILPRAFNLEVAKKYGWNPLLDDITKHADIMVNMIKGEDCDPARIFLT